MTVTLLNSINPFTANSTIPGDFNHNVPIDYLTAMWAKDGWFGDNLNNSFAGNEYPYIDYNNFYNLTNDYTQFDNSGVTISYNYGNGIYILSSTQQSITQTNLKWVVFKLEDSSNTTDNLTFNTNLTWISDYILFYLEEDVVGSSSAYGLYGGSTSYKTPWLDVQNSNKNASAIRTFTQGQNPTISTVLGTANGCNTKGSNTTTNNQSINRFRATGEIINRYLAFGIKKGNKLSKIELSYS